MMRLPRWRARPATRTERPPGQSMALITELTEHPLDPAYEDRAAARRARGGSGSSGLRSPLLLLAAALVGLLLVVAAQTLRVPQDRAGAQREQLAEQVRSAQSQNAGERRTNDRLRREISAAQAAAVGGSGQDELAQRLSRTERAAGAVPARGGGLTLTLDDRAGAGAAGGSDPRAGEGRGSSTLTSADLQIVVNGLWQAGAQAIDINGERLTAQSAIRFAGEAILVDFRPLARPYVLTVLGDPQLRSRFETTAGGDYLTALQRELDLRVQVEPGSALTVPAASGSVLHHARPLSPAAGAPSPATSPTRKDAP